MRRVELGIDSASSDAAVALLDGDELLIERRWTVETNYSRELLGGIDAALREAGVARDELAAIAVDAGPGGYSSLRSGVATVQGLALALDIPLAGVSRLETAAFPQLGRGRPVVATHEPGGGRVAWAAYELGDDGAPVVIEAPRLDELDACLSAAPRGARWCGELSEELLAALPGIEGTATPPSENVRLAADLVRLARLHEAYGDPALVDVVYLRPPSITRAAARTRTS